MDFIEGFLLRGLTTTGQPMSVHRRRAKAMRPWAWFAVLVVIGGLAGASVLFANSEGAMAVAEDAAVQVRVQEMIGAVSVSRATLSEAQLFTVAHDNGALSKEALNAVMAESRAVVDDLGVHLSSLKVVLPAGEAIEAVTSYLAVGSAFLADLSAGRPSDAQGSNSIELRVAYENAVGLLVAERDERELQIAAVRAGVGDVADSARFVVAFFVPAMAILWALAFMRRRQQQIRLETEIELEEQIRSDKDEFLAAIAHELRTPLTAVVGFAETLRDESRELSLEDRDELVDILADQASATAYMVEDLLVFARANIGDLTIRAEVIPVRSLVEKVAMAWAGRDESRLTVTGDGTIWADPLRVRQIVRNLLANAFVYGGPKVEVRISQNGADIMIAVADDGPGIPPGLRSLVFEPYQHGAAHEGQTAPMGLGLTVAQSLVRLMEGNLRYRYLGGESVFEVSLPAATAEQLELSEPQPRTPDTALKPSGAQIIEAIRQKQFEIVYQPIVELRHSSGGRRIVGFEALARFPVGSPPDWFAAAWGVGIGVELELEAIRAAVEGFREAPRHAFLALNTSLETLESSNLAQALAGISPSRIVLELSEDTVIDNYPRTKVYIDRLTRQGYRVAFDDVAAGRIDLWYLVRLRPAIVKMDISLIRDIDLEPSKRALVNGLKWLSDVLKSRVVAEGIERVEELELLTRIGAHYGQGYLLGRPGQLVAPTPTEAGTPTEQISAAAGSPV